MFSTVLAAVTPHAVNNVFCTVLAAVTPHAVDTMCSVSTVLAAVTPHVVDTIHNLFSKYRGCCSNITRGGQGVFSTVLADMTSVTLSHVCT